MKNDHLADLVQLFQQTGTGHNGTAKGRKRLRMDRMPQ